jgi:protein-tyrosine-phosphatase
LDIISILNLYIRILKKRPFLVLATTVVYAVVIATFIYIDKMEKESLTDSNFRNKISTEIINSMHDKTDIVELSEQIKIIFNAYDRKSKGELNKYGLVALLEDTYTLNAANPKMKNKLTLLMKLIKKQKIKDPYNGLKFEQEIIIKNIEDKFRIIDKNSSLNFVEQIKEVVRRQNLEIDELKQSNSMGIPLGITGLILTIVFGILGLIYPILTRK